MAQTGIEKAGGLPGTAKDDKKVVAGSFAVTVVIILLIVWGYIFIHKIQDGSQKVDLGGGAQDQFNFTSVKDAQNELKSSYGNLNQDLQDIRDESNNSGSSQQQTMMMVNDSPTDQFSNTTQ